MFECCTDAIEKNGERQMQISTLGEVMRKNDRLTLSPKPQGLHVYPSTTDGIVRIHVDLFVPSAIANTIIGTISSDILKQNGRP
jgi:hypothetical protein